MGNRAIITLEDEAKTKHPVALYLHWNGGLESIEAFMQVAHELPKNSKSVYDFHTTLCQVLRNFFGDGLCLYAHAASTIKGDAGCDNGVFHYRVGKENPGLVSWTDRPKHKSLDECVSDARKHNYWQGEDTILQSIYTAMPVPKKAAEHTNPVTMICGNKDCGSLNVVREAFASWNVETQQWEMAKVLDQAYCRQCELSTDLVELPIEGGN